MSSNTIQLDCSIQRRTCNQLELHLCHVRGVIHEPFGCEYPVFYCAIYKQTGANRFNIDGMAGFDSEYEKKSFTWTVYTQEAEVHIHDWYRLLHVDDVTFAQYSSKIRYTRGQRRLPASLHEHSIPYYYYPRTCEGPLLPQLVYDVLGSDHYTIVFCDDDYN